MILNSTDPYCLDYSCYVEYNSICHTMKEMSNLAFSEVTQCRETALAENQSLYRANKIASVSLSQKLSDHHGYCRPYAVHVNSLAYNYL